MLVLVAEDNDLIRQSVVECLLEERFTVVEALTGEGALTYLASTPAPDVLFTDMSMPGKINGWELAKRFREVLPNIIVIYTSGYSDDAAEAVEGSLFFEKPYQMEPVIKAIRALAKYDRPYQP
jgi:CheY-like chemotaxis protein